MLLVRPRSQPQPPVSAWVLESRGPWENHVVLLRISVPLRQMRTRLGALPDVSWSSCRHACRPSTPCSTCQEWLPTRECRAPSLPSRESERSSTEPRLTAGAGRPQVPAQGEGQALREQANLDTHTGKGRPARPAGPQRQRPRPSSDLALTPLTHFSPIIAPSRCLSPCIYDSRALALPVLRGSALPSPGLPPTPVASDPLRLLLSALLPPTHP